jgi:hypothetical protein
LLAAFGLLAACGASSPQIVFDATTRPPLTTTTAPPVTVATSAPRSTTTVTVEVSPPTDQDATPTTTEVAGDPPGTTTPSDDEPPATSAAPPAACATAGCSGPQIVAYPSLSEVPQLGQDPVRGSGCGLGDQFGNSMPDGLFFGSFSPDGGDVSFDVICVYYGASAIDKGADENASAFFAVNTGTRERQVPLAADFVYRVGTWTPDGQCVDAGPIGNADWAEADDGTVGWLTIAGGDATGAVAMCPI